MKLPPLADVRIVALKEREKQRENEWEGERMNAREVREGERHV